MAARSRSTAQPYTHLPSRPKQQADPQQEAVTVPASADPRRVYATLLGTLRCIRLSCAAMLSSKKSRMLGAQEGVFVVRRRFEGRLSCLIALPACRILRYVVGGVW